MKVAGKLHPYYGSYIASLGVPDARVIEAEYGAGSRIPEHVHDAPYLCLVMEGGYTEHVDGSPHACTAGMAIFHPAGERHWDSFGGADARLLMIEPSAGWLRRCEHDGVTLERRLACDRGPVARLAAQVREEAVVADQYSALAVEGLLLELAARVGRAAVSACRASAPPAWLLRVRECLREDYGAVLRMKELAAAEGVHPAELARQFRRHFHCTAGEYLRRTRTEAAARMLRDPRRALAMVALECGFASQSHFCTSFRHATGVTPQQYRRRYQ